VLLAGVSGPRLLSTVDAFFALSVRLPPPPQLDSCAIPQATTPTFRIRFLEPSVAASPCTRRRWLRSQGAPAPPPPPPRRRPGWPRRGPLSSPRRRGSYGPAAGHFGWKPRPRGELPEGDGARGSRPRALCSPPIWAPRRWWDPRRCSTRKVWFAAASASKCSPPALILPIYLFHCFALVTAFASLSTVTTGVFTLVSSDEGTTVKLN